MNIQASLVLLCLALACHQCTAIQAQAKPDANNPASPVAKDQVDTAGAPRRVQNVNIPLFYDMIKSGSSLGINVLQGLVKVERGAEAERNGLVGRRPLSIRILGVPVYERGARVRPAAPGSGPSLGNPGVAAAGRGGNEEEELPIEPVADLLQLGRPSN